MSTSVMERSKGAGEGAAAAAVDAALTRSARRPAIGLSVGALIALVVFALLAPHKTPVFRLSTPEAALQAPPLAVPAVAWGWIVAVLLLAAAAWAWYLAIARTEKVPGWVSGAAWVLFLSGLLVWLVGTANNPNISLVQLLTGAVALSLPIVFGSMSGALCERAGVVNIAIEGQLLLGAFGAALGGLLTGSALGAIVSAALGGLLVSTLLAVFAVKYLVNQIIVGVVLNVFASGLTGFLAGTLLDSSNSESFKDMPKLAKLPIPGLSELPVIGPALFQQTILGYVMFLLVPALWFALFKTKWGLRVRAVGEHPKAADTVGIKVNRIRVSNVLIAGIVAGVGGSYYTLVSTSQFSRDMTGGTGYIALAALIFGRWNPLLAACAGLLFGFVTNLQYVLAQSGTAVPSQFMAMLPYIVTLLAVAGLVGRSRGPAASGQPYVKE